MENKAEEIITNLELVILQPYEGYNVIIAKNGWHAFIGAAEVSM